MSIDHDVHADVDPEDISTNPSNNPSLADVMAARASRRTLLRGGTVVAAAGFLAGTAAVTDAAPAQAGGSRPNKPLLGFTAVPAGTADAVVVPEGYTASALIPWGTPLRSGGPAWRKDGSNTAAEQNQQIGMHHDGMHFFPAPGRDGNRRGLLVLNHEYVDPTLLYPDGDAVITKEKVDKALAGHGVSIVAVEKGRKGTWRNVDSHLNRRVTGATPVTFSGPVKAGHPALATGAAPAGTLNNCSHGVTPWGTYVACEENWNGYFGTADTSWTPTPAHTRYGVAASSSYRWHTADPRFDLATTPNEINRFGWVVEIDPHNPHSTPVKRTALGRIKHEGATFTESRGRVVVYTGDDQNGEYIYKFVGSAPWRLQRAFGISPLDHGTLYVGKFNDDGTGTWLPLVHGTGPLTAANGWADQADVLLRTRQAADAVGATKLDRPEWVAVHPDNKDVYLTLTNGSANTGAVNPRASNPYGHIIKWRERYGDNTATTFEWDIFILAGDPAYDPLAQTTEDALFGSPDGLWFDDDGRLWIQTDISNSVQNSAARGYDRIGNNQMLAADPKTGEIRRFLVGPRGAEITGVVTTPDQKTMFVNVQHPGETTPFWGTATPANPRAVSNWPDHDPDGRPRSATVVITKNDGGVIGS